MLFIPHFFAISLFLNIGSAPAQVSAEQKQSEILGHLSAGPKASVTAVAHGYTGETGSPLVLDCQASDGRFRSLSGLFQAGTSALLKIEGKNFSVWRPDLGTWQEHPCVRDSRNGQFCSINPANIYISEGRSLAPGVVESNVIEIDRTTTRFHFRHLFETSDVVRETVATGTCRVGAEPARPTTAF